MENELTLTIDEESTYLPQIVEDEKKRQANEEIRIDNEAQRQANEEERQANELQRQINEEERKTNELQRQANEKERAQTMQGLVNNFNTLKSDTETDINSFIDDAETEITNLIEEKSFYYKQYKNTYITTSNNETTIPIGIEEYNSDTLLEVYINGLRLVETTDYTINTTNKTITLTKALTKVGTKVYFVVSKSVAIQAEDYDNLRGENGLGVPAGGTAGQVLAKQSDTDNDTAWVDPTGGQASGDTLPVGSIMPYPKTTAPENWLICDGSAVSRTDYSELFNAIGTTFGEGDGSTTFNLPNFKGRVPVGLDITDTNFNTVGKTVGEKTHTLTESELPTHKHPNQHYAVSSDARNYRSYEATIATGTGNVYLATADSNDAGGGQAHNNIQPSIVTNYIIKAKQSAGLVATVVDSLDSTSETDALSAKQGKALNEKITKSSTYSTDEQVVGTWIDGKPIYRKVIDFGVLPNATSKLVPHNISDLKNFVKVEGIAIRDDNFSQMLPLVYRGTDVGYNTALVATNQAVSIQCDNDRSNFSAYVTLEYTKTTD